MQKKQGSVEAKTASGQSAKAQKKAEAAARRQRNIESKKRAKQQALARKQKKAWSPHVEDADKYGFYKLKNAPLRTMDEHQYEGILTDEERWNRLRDRMDSDFAHSLEMFPFEERPDEQVDASVNWIAAWSDGIGNSLKGLARLLKLSEIDLPMRFYSITRLDIEERFPGGRASGDPGDGDVRDMLSAFRDLFRENLAKYIFKKRQYQLLAVAAFIALTALLLACRGAWQKAIRDTCEQLLPDRFSYDAAAALATPVVITTALFALYAGLRYLFRRESETLFNVYNNSQTESCKTLDKQAALRTKNLANLIKTMAARIDSDNNILSSASRAEEWPERAFKWLLVVYWAGRRLENLERFTQLQIWLVRRTHYFYRLVASISNHFVNLLGFLAIGICGLIVYALAFAQIKLESVYKTIVEPVYKRLPDFGQFDLFGSSLSMPPVSATATTPVSWDNTVHYLVSQDIWHLSADALFVVTCGLGLILAVRFLLRVSELSTKNWNTSLDLIKQNLDVTNWDRFYAVNLHQTFARQVRSDKIAILRLESQLGGSKNR